MNKEHPEIYKMLSEFIKNPDIIELKSKEPTNEFNNVMNI